MAKEDRAAWFRDAVRAQEQRSEVTMAKAVSDKSGVRVEIYTKDRTTHFLLLCLIVLALTNYFF